MTIFGQKGPKNDPKEVLSYFSMKVAVNLPENSCNERLCCYLISSSNLLSGKNLVLELLS